MSAWVEDDSYPSGFRWDKDAPSIAPEPAMTRLPPRPDPDRMPPETTEHRHGGDE